MPDKDPTTYGLLTYAWVIGLSSWAGAVNFMRKLRSGHARAFNLVELVGEIMTSALAGLVTFWLAERAGMDGLTSAALIAIAGHMGSRALFRIEKWLERKFPIPEEGPQ